MKNMYINDTSAPADKLITATFNRNNDCENKLLSDQEHSMTDSVVLTSKDKDSTYSPQIDIDIVNDILPLCDCIIRYNSRGEIIERSPKQTVRNIEIILENDPRLKGKIRYDLFGCRIAAYLPLPWNDRPLRSWDDSDVSNLFALLQAEYGMKKKSDCIDAISNVAHRHSFHPVKETLESLEYHGDGFIRNLLPTYLGCEDTDYTYTIMRLFMLGAINRIFHPGCKFDYCLMVQGPQGVGKSTFFQLLALDDGWFNDSLDSLDSKEAVQSLLGSWIIELAELKSFNRTSGGVDSIKRFLTTRQDKIRLPYDKYDTNFPRQCVFTGTTNRADFLMDDTGNRRFLIVRCGIQKVTANLFSDDAIDVFRSAWAEAMHIYKSGDYSMVLDQNMINEASKLQKQAEIDDYRIDRITEYLGDSNLAYIPDIWTHALGEVKTIEKWQTAQISQILVNMGFKKISEPKRYKGELHRNVYEREEIKSLNKAMSNADS